MNSPHLPTIISGTVAGVLSHETVVKLDKYDEFCGTNCSKLWKLPVKLQFQMNSRRKPIRTVPIQIQSLSGDSNETVAKLSWTGHLRADRKRQTAELRTLGTDSRRTRVNRRDQLADDEINTIR